MNIYNTDNSKMNRLLKDIEVPPEKLFENLWSHPFAFFLDSGLGYPKIGERSFLGCNPLEYFSAKGNLIEIKHKNKSSFFYGNPFSLFNSWIESKVNQLSQSHKNLAPLPFAVGFISYESGEFIEKAAKDHSTLNGIPHIFFALYDVVYCWDHTRSKGWIDSLNPKAEEKLCHIISSFKKNPKPFYRLSLPYSKVSIQDYFYMVNSAIRYIKAGDIYQVNLAYPFWVNFEGNAGAFYLDLRKISPAPLGAFMNLNEFQIVSNSPERFLYWNPKTRYIETRPIKGTRPRGRNKIEDKRLKRELKQDSKEQAEHVMIVDLERNDLGQISVPSSVKVTEFESIYTLPYVHHLVSTISARTKEGVSLEHIFKATFPGGSITGAPKLRARQIIAKYEPFKRGIYTGALGYIDRQGGCNLNIAIRTGIIKENKLCFFVGSGIVADSDPENEYRETLTKAKAFLNLTKKNEKKSELFGSLR